MGRCYICYAPKGEKHEASCENYREECSECGEEFPDKHFDCFTHLESTEDLKEYAHGVVEEKNRWRTEANEAKKCRDKLIEENRGLNVLLEKAHDRESEYEKSVKSLIDQMNRLTADSLGITKGE